MFITKLDVNWEQPLAKTAHLNFIEFRQRRVRKVILFNKKQYFEKAQYMQGIHFNTNCNKKLRNLPVSCWRNMFNVQSTIICYNWGRPKIETAMIQVWGMAEQAVGKGWLTLLPSDKCQWNTCSHNVIGWRSTILHKHCCWSTSPYLQIQNQGLLQ